MEQGVAQPSQFPRIEAGRDRCVFGVPPETLSRSECGWVLMRLTQFLAVQQNPFGRVDQIHSSEICRFV
jgi:hypothetical protein